jgi:hypothetical protein
LDSGIGGQLLGVLQLARQYGESLRDNKEWGGSANAEEEREEGVCLVGWVYAVRESSLGEDVAHEKGTNWRNICTRARPQRASDQRSQGK